MEVLENPGLVAGVARTCPVKYRAVSTIAAVESNHVNFLRMSILLLPGRRRMETREHHYPDVA